MNGSTKDSIVKGSMKRVVLVEAISEELVGCPRLIRGGARIGGVYQN